MNATPLRISRTRLQLGATLLAVAVFALAVLGAWKGGKATAAKGSATLGQLQITNARLPEPASPDEAVIYLTVKNRGATDDELTGVSADFAGGGMLMREQTQGSATQMQPLDGLVIPAHGQAALSPGASHAMLVGLTSAPRQGDTVTVTLRFKNAGAVSLKVPVTSYAQE
jgi:periplasmic copper chaperone A